MEFWILGDLEVRAGAGRLALGGPRDQKVLAMLLLGDGRSVPVARLIDALWDEDPPATAARQVQNAVSRLRQLLAGAGTLGAMTAEGAGYRLALEGATLDARLFEAQVAQARAVASAGRAADAAGMLRSALDLWRGPALAGLRGAVIEAAATAWNERRSAVQAMYHDCQLALGRHHEVLGELSELAAADPWREGTTGQLMLALYRCGRQSEALDRYRGTQELLRTAGLDPGPALRHLHQQILNHDPALAGPDPAPAGGVFQVPTGLPQGLRGRRGGPPVPRELPADLRVFAGRVAELAELNRLLPDAAGDPGAVVILAVAGTAGVGKTALAVQWAHRAAGRFPDGQLYVNLRGYDPGPPMPAADALAGFLRSLGVPGQEVPPGAAERAARYRSLLAGKRMLVVLDNAGSADQVRPLLPGTPTCAVVVTSRDALPGLVARDGAARLDLDLLPVADAAALLRTLIGTRVDAEPDAAAELAELCCRLPLALRVAAELAASRPAVPLSGLAGELADLRTRLDVLEPGGDPGAEVRTVFSWSCRHLDPGAARVFRLLGLHPGPDFEPYAVAALTGAGVEQTRRAVAVLARAHLLYPAGPGRHGMHDLLRGYARELTDAVETGPGQRMALTGLLDHYLRAAAAAMDTLFPAQRHHRPRIGGHAAPVLPLADPAAAREWLNGERAALVAAARHAAAHGWPGHATRLAATISSYLHNGGHLPEALTIYGHALDAARRTGDRAAEATALGQIGDVHGEQGRLRQAGDHYRQALALFHAAGDRAGAARTLGSLGLDETELGRYEQAARHQEEAGAICGEIGDSHGVARALGNLGLARQRQGRYQEAAGYYQHSLDLFRQIGDREGEAWALARLGVAGLRLGRCQRAARYLEQALALFHDMGHAVGEAEVLARLGEVYLHLDRHEQATGNLQRSLTMSREIGRIVEADALNGLGDLLLQSGHPDQARAHHAAALQIASEAGAPLNQAHAHNGLARAYQADGDTDAARHHWQEALTRYTAIGAPEARETRARLATC